MGFELLVRNTSEVLTLQGEPGSSAEPPLGAIPQGVVGVRGGRIAFLGQELGVPDGAVTSQTRIIDAQGGFVSPGLVDPHTHVVFAGERAAEFELRCQGRSYQELAAVGGGIASTVRATRRATAEELFQLALPRLERLLSQGVTTVEVKTGYGLELEQELKLLEVMASLSRAQPITIVPTLLCAHAVPEEHRAHRERYVDQCVNEIIPAAGRNRLARFCDVFVEEGAFTHGEARRIARAAAEHGLALRLHVDQLTANAGAELAAELGAASADHLENVSASGIEALAAAGTTAVLVPVSTLFLRQRRYAPGRKLRDAGVPVALGTNVNPGSAMSENVGLTLSLACLENGLTAAEALDGLTRSAARALRLPDAGRLVEGAVADLVVFGCASHRHLPYHLGVNHARWVVVGGRIVRDPAASGGAWCPG